MVMAWNFVLSQSVCSRGEKPKDLASERAERKKEISTQVEHLSLEISSYEREHIFTQQFTTLQKQETTAIFIH